MKIIKTKATIISRKISIPLNGEPSRITFQLSFANDKFRKYNDILKNYDEEFIRECIGKKVHVTLEKTQTNEYEVIEMNY